MGIKSTIDYQKILSGPEYFHCDHYHCTMSHRACLTNQNIAKAAKKAPRSRAFKLGHEIVDRSISCLDCDQGKQIKSEIKKTTTKRKRGRIQVNRGKCRKRGCDNPAKTRGLCRKHYQQLLRKERRRKNG